MWHDALLVVTKDLKVELSSKVALNQVLPFGVVVVVLLGLALGPDPASLEKAAAGLFWIAVLLSTVLAVQRSFAIEARDGDRDGLRLSGLDPGGIFVGKAAAVALELVVLELVVGFVVSVLFRAPLSGLGVLFLSCLAATVGLAAVGTLYGALASGTRVKETLLPLVFFPVVAPVLIAATKTWQAALGGAASGGLGWLDLLAVFGLVYFAIGTVAFGPILEDR